MSQTYVAEEQIQPIAEVLENGQDQIAVITHTIKIAMSLTSAIEVQIQLIADLQARVNRLIVSGPERAHPVFVARKLENWGHIRMMGASVSESLVSGRIRCTGV